MRKDNDAYEALYALISPVVKDKKVLELAAGTGLISKNIADKTKSIEVTDASAKMIKEAQKGAVSPKMHFSVQDMFHLPYEDGSFEVVIIANALHIIPDPEKALCEIRRVLKPDGVLIAPTFTHANNSISGELRAFFMKLIGFPLHSKWTGKDYLDFLCRNNLTIQKSVVLKASFPLTYAELYYKKEQ